MEHKEGISRRAFLKTAAAVGAALTIQPTMNKVQAANAAINMIYFFMTVISF